MALVEEPGMPYCTALYWISGMKGEVNGCQPHAPPDDAGLSPPCPGASTAVSPGNGGTKPLLLLCAADSEPLRAGCMLPVREGAGAAASCCAALGRWLFAVVPVLLRTRLPGVTPSAFGAPLTAAIAATAAADAAATLAGLATSEPCTPTPGPAHGGGGAPCASKLLLMNSSLRVVAPCAASCACRSGVAGPASGGLAKDCSPATAAAPLSPARSLDAPPALPACIHAAGLLA